VEGQRVPHPPPEPVSHGMDTRNKSGHDGVGDGMQRRIVEGARAE